MITIQLKDAQKMAGIVQRTLPRNSPKPILNGVLVEAESGTVRFVTYNMSAGLRAEAPELNGHSERFVILNGERFLNFLKVAEGMHLGLEYKGNQVHLEAREAKLKLPAADALEYPDLPFVRTFVEFPGLIRGLNKTYPFTEGKGSVSARAGVHVQVQSGHIAIEATSGREAARFRSAAELLDADWIIASEDAKDACAIFSADQAVYAERQDGFLLLSDGSGITWIARLLDRKFPDLSNIFAVQSVGRWNTNRNALLGATKRALAIISDKGNRSAKLKFEPQFLRLVGESPYGDVEEMIAGEYTGEPRESGFDLLYLQHLLNQWETENVQTDLFALKGSTLGLVFRGEQEEYILAGALMR